MRDVILTDRGPKPIGPYSQAIRTNGFLYVSGQVALDPKTGEMKGTDVREQTERVFENVKGILEAAGSNLHHIVKTWWRSKSSPRSNLFSYCLCLLELALDKLYLRCAGVLSAPQPKGRGLALAS